MPRTISGKLDRRAVESLNVTHSSADVAAKRPMSTIESQLTEIWKDVLSHGPHNLEDISTESDFFQMGGTSMLLLEVQAQIRKRFNTSLMVVDLFNSCTLYSMAQLIEHKCQVRTRVLIDWEAETALPEHFNQIVPLDARPSTVNPKTIVLTGVSAPLGQYILQTLLQSLQVEKVICIAVRRLQERLDTNQLSQDPRVIYHEGDLRLPLLGLSKLEADRIFSQADSTIHSAAEVSHLKSYSNLRDTNVASTKQLTRLCLPRRIPIHYVSTAGVAMFAVGDTFDEVSASSTPPPTDGGDGYSASKWANERFLERVNAALDLPVWIHRPSGIMRPPNEEHNQDELLLSILHFSKKIRAMSETHLIQGTLDLVSIQNVSRNIVKDVLENNPRTPNGLSYVHRTGDIVIPLDQMKEYIERESEEPLPVVEKLTEWAERAELVGLQSSLANVLKNADQLGILQVHIPRLVRKYRNE